MSSSFLRRLAAVAGLAATLSLPALPPARAATPEETAARLEALGVTVGGRKPSAADLGEVSMVTLHGDRARGLTDADCAMFAALPKLRLVALSGAKLSRTCLAAVAAAPGLATVSLATTEIERGSLAALAAASALESIQLSDVRGIAPEDLGALAGLRGLRQFILGYTLTPVGRTAWFDDRALLEIARLAKVETLTLTRVRATATGIAALAAMPALRDLTLDRGQFGEDALEPLAGSRLVTLKLSENVRIGPRLPAIVSRIATLRRLDVSSTAIGGNLAPLAGMPRLDTFDASYTLLTRDDLAVLGAVPALTQVTVNDVLGVDDAGMRALAASKTLRSVALSRTMVTDAGLAALLAVPTIRTVYAADNAVTDAAVAKAAGSRIANLDLSNSDIGDAGLAALAELPDLGSVSLRNTAITDAGIAAAKAKRPNFNVYR